MITTTSSTETTYREKLDFLGHSGLSADELFDFTKKQAAESFQNHKVTRFSDSEFMCARPNSIVWSFRILFPPGAVIVYGDVGEMILTQYDLGIGWLRGAVHSPGYLLGKCSKLKKEFSPVDAAIDLDLMAQRGEEGLAEAIWESWDVENCDEWTLEDGFQQAYIDNVGDFASYTIHEKSDLYCYNALLWFVEKYLEVVE